MAKHQEAKKYIRIRGAQEHNLKNVSLDIPREEFVVFTGLSGSGKSSLAFDTIYAEGQRRYMESLSSYARMFLGRMEKPNVALKGFRRLFRSIRNPQTATHVLQSELLRKSMIISVFFLQEPAFLIVQSVEKRSKNSPLTRWLMKS